MITDSPHLYRINGIRLEVADEVIRNALAAAGQVESKGLSSVLSLGHLAHSTGASYAYLRDVVTRHRDPYSDIVIPRRNGRNMRAISSPEPSLLHVQRWILKRILDRMPVDRSSYAYSRGRSIKKCAAQHLGATWLLKMDIRNFFESIDEISVFRLFSTAGYRPLPALELARICTRYAGHVDRDMRRFQVSSDGYTQLRAYARPYLGFVPQGAPTSGAIANRVAAPLDGELRKIADRHNLVYTRYADDMTLSSSEPFKRSQVLAIMNQAHKTIQRNGFAVHSQKTRIVPPGARKVVLGLLVDGDSVRLTRKMRQRILLHVRGVERFGFSDHARHTNFSSVDGLVHHVTGLVAFAYDIEPAWADNLMQRWETAVGGEPELSLPSFDRRGQEAALGH